MRDEQLTEKWKTVTDLVWDPEQREVGSLARSSAREAVEVALAAYDDEQVSAP